MWSLETSKTRNREFTLFMNFWCRAILISNSRFYFIQNELSKTKLEIGLQIIVHNNSLHWIKQISLTSKNIDTYKNSIFLFARICFFSLILFLCVEFLSMRDSVGVCVLAVFDTLWIYWWKNVFNQEFFLLTHTSSSHCKLY